VFKDQSKEDEKLGSAARLMQFIQERIGHGQDPEEFPKEMLLNLEVEDREWFTRLVRQAGGLYREEPDQGDENPDAEEVMEVETNRTFELGDKRDIDVAARLYPVSLERPLTTELINKIMGHVQRQLSLSFTPPTCKTFCKSLKLWELKSDRNYRPE
jgi:hypothetical protein